jgi:hypothetical protein
LDRFDFFRKFAEIFAAQGAPPVVSTTTVGKWNAWTPLKSRVNV